ncbi:chlorite dismutase family protein [Candidatus Nitrospira bockiana]
MHLTGIITIRRGKSGGRHVGLSRPAPVPSVMFAWAIALFWLLVLPAPEGHAADREKLLSDPGVFATFVAVKIAPDWWKLDKTAKESAAAAVKAVIDRHGATVLVETVLLRGLSDHADLLFRMHSTDLAQHQQFLLDLFTTPLGRHLLPVYTFNGVTKKANYIPAFSDDLKAALKTPPDPGPKTYAIVIPIRKDAAWWLLDKETRTSLMKEHTDATVAYLKTVRRKLYHSTGLDDFDFITYFETSNLMDFHSLVLGLQQVKENQHNRRFGSPTLLGTIQSVDAVLEILAR